MFECFEPISLFGLCWITWTPSLLPTTLLPRTTVPKTRTALTRTTTLAQVAILAQSHFSQTSSCLRGRRASRVCFLFQSFTSLVAEAGDGQFWMCFRGGSRLFVGHVQHPCDGFQQRSAIRQTFRSHVAVLSRPASMWSRRGSLFASSPSQRRPFRSTMMYGGLISVRTPHIEFWPFWAPSLVTFLTYQNVNNPKP